MPAFLLGGCGSLSASPPLPGAVQEVAMRPQYRLEIQAPRALKDLLSRHLDLARFQNAPAGEDITGAELDRLRTAAPAQIRELLETEGYFNAGAVVEIKGADSAGLPQVLAVVEPGPQATIGTVAFDMTGPLKEAADSSDPVALRSVAELRQSWALRSGAVFRPAAWADAKTAALNKAHSEGYAAARWSRTTARVDAPENRVDVAVVLESGPLFRLGSIRIQGLSRYDEDSVRHLAQFAPGDAYSEKGMQEFQDRLQKVGLFEGALVEINADPAQAAAADVNVRVKESPRQQATVGVGYSGNTGVQASFEHIERRLFDSRWMMKNKVQLGSDLNSWAGDLTSHPLDGMYRNLVSGAVSSLWANDQWQRSWKLRVGRAQDTPRLERTWFAEVTHASVESTPLTNQAEAVSLNEHWVFREVDSVLLPTDGYTASAQGALGYGRGTEVVPGAAFAEARGPFARLYARLTWYRPFGDAWYGTARIEAGQVLSHNVIGVPDTFLFRAGGDDSVRGYGYRTLGPTNNGATASGRSLLTGSVEIARPIWADRPAYWWAVFVDAGNAADSFADLKPALGYGVGLRWRSPVGPLRVDLAYGQEVHQLRMHMSVGIAF